MVWLVWLSLRCHTKANEANATILNFNRWALELKRFHVTTRDWSGDFSCPLNYGTLSRKSRVPWYRYSVCLLRVLKKFLKFNTGTSKPTLTACFYTLILCMYVVVSEGNRPGCTGTTNEISASSIFYGS